jgi:putative transposase
MREHHLLSPHRGRQGNPRRHEGRIITDAPNRMWATDGTRILTVEDGWVWLFGAFGTSHKRSGMASKIASCSI